MKKYFTILGCLALFFIGTQASISQNLQKKQSEAANKQDIIDHDSAKKQTFDLHQIVNLDGDQVSKVHDLFLDLDKRQRLVSSASDMKMKDKSLVEIETFKNEQLKKLLTEAQFDMYLKSMRKE